MIYTFGDFELDTCLYSLYHAGQPIHLRPKVFQVLTYLLHHRDRVVSKQELCEQVWPEQFISDTTLEGTIRAVRQVMGDSGRAQRFIQTLHGHGYRFVASVTEAHEASESAAIYVPRAAPEPPNLPALQPAPLVPEHQHESRIDGTTVCQACGHTNRISAKFCEGCGTPLTIQCTHCEHAIRATAKFCDQCGYTLTQTYTPRHLSEKILASKSAVEGERKQVTVLFADVVGFTALAEQLDPEDVHTLMDGCFERLIDIVHHYEGTVNQFTGDGIMALFGAPIAHEDHPQRALPSALAIQEAMQGYGEHLQRDMGVDFRLRIGINTGLVVVGNISDSLRMDCTAQGDTVNLAARLQTLAEPGTVLVSDATYRLARGYFTFLSLGTRQIRGRSPTRVFQVTGHQPGRTRIDIAVERGLAAFVGRQLELELMAACLSKSQQGHGQVVSIVGEAGVGKSRLLLELPQRLPGEGLTFMQGRCLSYGRSSIYLPLVAMLKQYFAIDADANVQSIEAGIRHGVEELGLDSAAIVPYLCALLSGKTDGSPLQERAPEARRSQTFAALLSLFAAISRRAPLVLIVEDLHWIDQPSQAFLTLLVESLGAIPLLLLVTYRSGYQHSWREKSYGCRSHIDGGLSSSSI